MRSTVTPQTIARDNAIAARAFPPKVPTAGAVKGSDVNPIQLSDDFHIGNPNPLFPWVQHVKDGADGKLKYGASHPNGDEVDGFETQEALAIHLKGIAQ